MGPDQALRHTARMALAAKSWGDSSRDAGRGTEVPHYNLGSRKIKKGGDAPPFLKRKFIYALKATYMLACPLFTSRRTMSPFFTPVIAD